jgi:hypothetical protein
MKSEEVYLDKDELVESIELVKDYSQASHENPRHQSQYCRVKDLALEFIDPDTQKAPHPDENRNTGSRSTRRPHDNRSEADVIKGGQEISALTCKNRLHIAL